MDTRRSAARTCGGRPGHGLVSGHEPPQVSGAPCAAVAEAPGLGSGDTPGAGRAVGWELLNSGLSGETESPRWLHVALSGVEALPPWLMSSYRRDIVECEVGPRCALLAFIGWSQLRRTPLWLAARTPGSWGRDPKEIRGRWLLGKRGQGLMGGVV